MRRHVLTRLAGATLVLLLALHGGQVAHAQQPDRIRDVGIGAVDACLPRTSRMVLRQSARTVAPMVARAPSSRALARAMKAAGMKQPAGTAAHHIVAGRQQLATIPVAAPLDRHLGYPGVVGQPLKRRLR